MIQFCEKTLLYTDGVDRERLLAGGPLYDATLWNIALIGEAANHIPAAVKGLGPTIPWRDVVDTRNNLIHHYFGIDDNAVWEIITVHIPALLPQLRGLLESLGESSR
ncbi:MAG: DUF86 domain-containing protein [Chloroflexi bacterium]|nr:DUF86 domain-containing protein [Chloroflexota bacterium]